MKAVILAAGIGSRIRPLTDNCPKCLLKIGDHTILDMMLSNIRECGITEIVFVLGYLEDQIREFVQHNFPDLKSHFVTNHRFMETNTGYSLMLAKNHISGSDFIKFDADVVFDKSILKNLIACKHKSCLCIDKNIKLDAEEIKVIVDSENKVVKANKSIDPLVAVGESIGIEKIDRETAIALFSELEFMMDENQNLQEYYEGAYERLIEKNIPFHTLDISDLTWAEIDTNEDYVGAIEASNYHSVAIRPETVEPSLNPVLAGS